MYFLPLPGGLSVPLDNMGQPDFARMVAGTAHVDDDATASAPVVLGPRLVETAPVFRSSTTVRDPKWLIFGLFGLALLWAGSHR